MPYTEDERDYFNDFAGLYWIDYREHRSMRQLAEYSDELVYEFDLQ